MQNVKEKTALVWFRNDLRTRDNAVLSAACKEAHHVIAVYFFDPRHFETDRFGFQKTAKFRARFLIESVQDLRKQLESLNITLVVSKGKPEDHLPTLCHAHGADTLYFQKEWTQEEADVEQAVRQRIGHSVKIESLYNQFLFHPDDVGRVLNKIPRVFTEFRKRCEKYVEVRPVDTIAPRAQFNQVEHQTEIPVLSDLGFEDFEADCRSAFPFTGGETAGLKRLEYYFFESKKLGYYKKTRNGLIGKDYSSKFSPWLANGSLSARTIYWKVREFENTHLKNQSTYWLIFELIWRDFFKYISLEHGNSLFALGGILNRNYKWNQDEKLVQKWINGETQSDFVNANMLELKYTGWMSNRGRQNVASYFAKELMLDWRIGAAYFESMLLDYDVHSNYGNWMYVAGVGNDPRDRKFNVEHQAERYDANSRFRKTWLQPKLF